MIRSNDAGISQRTNLYAERTMLMHAKPVIVLDKFGQTKPLPKNKSTTIRFRRPKVFTPATTPLVEGVTPSTTAFQYEDVSTQIRQYGQVVEITDVIEDTHEDPVLQDVSVQCGENIGRTLEQISWGVLRAGTSVTYANGAARNAVNTPISLTKLRAVVRYLRAQKAMMITRMLSGSADVATRPIEASFIAIAHTDLEADIRNLAGFTPIAQYGTRQIIHEQELGTVENLRFLLSPDLGAFPDAGGLKGGMVSTSGTSADVYPIIILGKEAYGVVPLGGRGAVEPTIIPVGQKTKDDPLGQRGIVGWKTWHAAVILNQSWMQRLEVAATAL
jgi:N4-gp56 family major capsid protein